MMLNVTNVKSRYDYCYTKNYLNNLNKKTDETISSISLQSSPIHKTNSTAYSRSTNSTPQHFYTNTYQLNHRLNGEESSYNFIDSNEDYLEDEQNSSSLEELNCELNNQNSSNDEYDNSEESNDGEHCKIFNKRFRLNNKITSNLYNQTYIKHSRSYQNNFSFDLDSSTRRINLLDKPTSLSLSGNNLNNKLNYNEQQSPNNQSRSQFWYIMNGDYILNLSKTSSEENPMVIEEMTNFKIDKTEKAATILNKHKMRKLKDERRLVTSVNSNNANCINNCVNNSDQMRECLSPEIIPNDKNKKATNQLESINNTINDQLNDHSNSQLINDEHLIILSDSNGGSSVGLSDSGNEIEGSTNELIENTSSNDTNEDIVDDLINDKSNQILNSNQQKTCKINETESDDNATSTKRYPTFIQQTENSLESPLKEQSNLHQKSIDEASAKRLAKRLYNLDKFKKTDVSRHLSKNNEFNKAVASEYCSFFEFSNLSLIDALRIFLSRFSLIGETQERERILLHFAKRFFTCNPTVFSSIDAIYTLTCSLMLLNQDLHGDYVAKKMSLNDFIENLKSMDNGQNFSRDLLKDLYNKIKSEKLEWCDDEDDRKDDYSVFNNGTITNTILEIPNSTNSIEYKRGYILRKSCLQANGKRVSLGKRKWKSYLAVLRDAYLYLYKKDDQAKSQIYDSVKNSIRLYHAVAFVASDYSKKKFVLRLCTADGSEFLISLNSKQELDSWIEIINLVAASLSAPPINDFSDSQKKNYPLKTILPVNNTTKYQFKEQLNDHESRRIRINDEIQEITNNLRLNYNNLAGKKAKNTVLQLKYLKHEYERYSAYCKVMKKVKQNSNSILEKCGKNMSIKSKPLTTLVIGEEPLDSIKNIDEE